MTVAVKPLHHETIYYDLHDPITGQKETRSYQVTSRWAIKDEQDHVVEENRKSLTHWHRESLEAKAAELNGTIKEHVMKFNIVKVMSATDKRAVAGPYDEADAPAQRKRLAEQHPEAEFEIVPITPDAA